jgi:DNA-binding IscR family transcriptional regulator
VTSVPRNEAEVLAVRILAALAVHPDGLVSSDRLGELLDANPVVVRRLTARLKWEGIVETRRGSGGGIALSREPAAITLGRVHRALHDPDGGPASALSAAFAAANSAYVSELDRWTLAQVMDASS